MVCVSIGILFTFPPNIIKRERDLVQDPTKILWDLSPLVVIVFHLGGFFEKYNEKQLTIGFNPLSHDPYTLKKSNN